jgi:hypothetical protein
MTTPDNSSVDRYVQSLISLMKSPAGRLAVEMQLDLFSGEAVNTLADQLGCDASIDAILDDLTSRADGSL